MRFGRRARGRRATRLALALTAVATAVITAACATTPPTAAPTASMPAPAATAIRAASSAIAKMPGHAASASATKTPSPAGASASRGRPQSSATPSAAPSSPVPQTSSAASTQTSGDTRLVTFVNKTSQTIWVAAAPNQNTPLAATGWELGVGQSTTIAAPNNLNTRFWGRTGCTFNSQGVGSCQTGDCGGLFQCKGWGTIPATLAEVNFDAWDGLDFYDVSMVDGSNLPMYINITKSSGGTKDKISPNGCVAAGCTKPVNCPSALDVKAGSAVVGCISACARLGGDQYCCRGQWSARSACDPTKWPVDYAEVFKSAEPYAYSYTDDDATSVFTCSGVCDYRVTFGISH